jgi:RNA-directed DNA polymerase
MDNLPTFMNKSLAKMNMYHEVHMLILNKYMGFKASKVKAVKWLRQITEAYPNLFCHWEIGLQISLSY